MENNISPYIYVGILMAVAIIYAIKYAVMRGKKMMKPEDHVMFDIPKTLEGAARSTGRKNITIHEYVYKLKANYKEFFRICEDRGISVMVAMADTYERVPLESMEIVQAPID